MCMWWTKNNCQSLTGRFLSNNICYVKIVFRFATLYILSAKKLNECKNGKKGKNLSFWHLHRWYFCLLVLVQRCYSFSRFFCWWWYVGMILSKIQGYINWNLYTCTILFLWKRIWVQVKSIEDGRTFVEKNWNSIFLICGLTEVIIWVKIVILLSFSHLYFRRNISLLIIRSSLDLFYSNFYSVKMMIEKKKMSMKSS